MEEQWKPIEGYEGYQISNFGRVKSFKRYPQGKILKPIPDKLGYLRINLAGHGKREWLLHRLVAQAFIPNPDNKPQINHLNGIKADNRVENLEWATNKENCCHAYDTGLHKVKITDEQLLYIRNNPENLNGRELAKKFNVTPSTICCVQLGKTHGQTIGNVREKIDRRLPDEIRRQIRMEYKKGVKGFGNRALGEKYNLGRTTILRIVKEEETK